MSVSKEQTLSKLLIYHSNITDFQLQLKSMGRFRIQWLYNKTWNTHSTIHKNSQYSNSSTDWTLLNSDFTVENYGIKLIYYKIDTPHANMCFSISTKTHSVYWNSNTSNHFHFKRIM